MSTPKVAQFLGNLVGGGSKPGRPTKADIADEGRPDGQATEEVVKAIA
jgi:hypothetical protein